MHDNASPDRRPISRRTVTVLLAAVALTAGLVVRGLLDRHEEKTIANIDTTVPVRPVANAPFITTPQDVVDKMVELASLGEGDLLYDLGCGDGRIAIAAAKQYGCRAVGYDIDPERVDEARQAVKDSGVEDLVTIEQADVFTLDLSPANRITMYLLPMMQEKLIPQLQELSPGSRIIAHDFKIKGVPADEVVDVTSADGHEHSIFIWTTPLKRE